MSKRLFISDLHLQAVDAPAYLRFRELLQVEGQWADAIYILGDLVEMWIGDDDDSPLARQMTQDLQAAAKATQIYLMHGNRDFLMGEDFAGRAGCTLLADPHVTEDKLLLCHGDSLCTDDKEYQMMRTLLRSAEWQQDILSKSLAERKQIGDGMRAQSRTSNANKPSNIMDVNPAATMDLIEQYDGQTLIHGHTHRPGMHRVNGVQRIVTGAWENCGWLCRQSDGALQLECFSLARRYGT